MPGEIHRNPEEKKPIIEVRTFCRIDKSDCNPDSKGIGSCGDYVSECSWHDTEP